MYFITINNKEYVTAHDKTLLTFLRDELNMTAIKDGKNADWVLVDGERASAGDIRLGMLKDKKILTVEGISSEEMQIYTWCFGQTGALDNSFFVPGMIISAKGLMDMNSDPSREEVIQSVSSEPKVVEAVMMAAEYLRENKPVPAVEQADLEKAGGKVLFADDINVSRMLYARPVFGKYPGAKIRNIDLSRIIENPRCGDILLKEDFPCNTLEEFHGGLESLSEDKQNPWDNTSVLKNTLILGVGDTVQKEDDVVALVVTTYLQEMKKLCMQVQVDYVIPDTPMEKKTCGQQNLDQDIPECAAAVYHNNDTLTVYTNSSHGELIKEMCARVLDIPEDWINCVSSPVIGARTGRAEIYAALTAWLTQQSVKIKF